MLCPDRSSAGARVGPGGRAVRQRERSARALGESASPSQRVAQQCFGASARVAQAHAAVKARCVEARRRNGGRRRVCLTTRNLAGSGAWCVAKLPGRVRSVVATQKAKFLENNGLEDDVCPFWRRRSLKSKMLDFD